MKLGHLRKDRVTGGRGRESRIFEFSGVYYREVLSLPLRVSDSMRLLRVCIRKQLPGSGATRRPSRGKNSPLSNRFELDSSVGGEKAMKSESGRVRLIDVAKEAGVSVTTASDALGDSPRVRTETRERVRRVAAQLRYQPNRVAQDLVRRAPSSVTVVFSGPESLNFLSNPFFIQLFRPVVETLNVAGTPVFTEITTDAKEAERLEYHAFGGSSGAIILIGTRLADRELSQLAARLPIPIITVVRHPLPGAKVGVAVDNFEIGTLAARHLLDFGHSRVGYIGASPGVGLGEERLEGFEAELKRRGLSLSPGCVRPGDFYQESGRLAMLEILDVGGVTAVFAANDLMALGALEACRERGVSVPDEMSILGCDDIPNLNLLSVPLSSISLPIRDIGVLAARQALSVMSGQVPDAPVTLRAGLTPRASTARVNSSVA